MGDPDVTGAGLSERGLEAACVDVVPGVVGHDAVHADAVLSEEGGGAAKELGAGVAPFVRMDLGIGKPGMVIDGGVDVVVAHASAHGPASPLLGGASANAMTTALRNATKLLHVDVNSSPGVARS
jgi:hypothetical protein